MGIEGLKVLAKVLADVLNTASKLLHGQGLVVLFALSQDWGMLSNVDYAAVKKELSDLSAEERKEIEDVFINSLALVDQAVQAKIQAGVGVLDSAVKVVEDAVAVVKAAKALLS